MNIKIIKVGYLEENCYIVEKNDNCIIIDPGDEAEKIINYITLNVTEILITHYHFDHIGALKELQDKYKVGVNSFDNPYFNYEVIETPGHTADSKTFYFKDDNIMFVGDFIFKDSIGRMDLPTGSVSDMKKSLDKILTYPLNTILYPGHGEFTTIEKEKENINSYFL